MKNNKNVKSNNQKYEQVSQSDDKSEIIIFQTNKKISVSCFSTDKGCLTTFCDCWQKL